MPQGLTMGRRRIEPEESQRFITGLEIAKLKAVGYTDQEIAYKTKYSISSFKIYLDLLRDYFDVNNTYHLITVLLQKGHIKLEELEVR